MHASNKKIFSLLEANHFIIIFFLLWMVLQRQSFIKNLRVLSILLKYSNGPPRA